MRRLAIGALLLVMWSAFGFGVYHLLEAHKSVLATEATASTPVDETTIPLPGTLYLTQGGVLYSFINGHFTKVSLPSSHGAWMQPAAGPGGNLFLVARSDEYADVYLVDPVHATVVQQLTHNANRRVELNAWSFWPHLAADGSTVISGWDGPKYGTSYEVHFAVWSGTRTRLDARQWTNPTLYTGGDVDPVPLPSGGVLYAHYALDGNQILSQVAMVTRAGATPVYLTQASADCGSPALSPDGNEVAMVCTSNTQTAQLEVMSLDGGVAGTPRVVIAGCLCAVPQFSPDGQDLVYLAPAAAGGRFQLWWIKGGGTPAPAAPEAITSHLDLDATSAPAWLPA